MSDLPTARRARPGIAAWIVSLAAAPGLSGLEAAEIRLEAKAYIEVQADGKHCSIGKVSLLCADALEYLRGTLKLAPGSEVGVKASRAAPYKDVRRVLDDLGNSEFRHPVALVTVPRGGNGK